MAADVFTGGRIITMDPALAEPDVVVVDGGRIAAAGERALVDAYPGAVVHDLAGRTLVPGFIDAHNHLSIAALHPRWRDVSAAASLDELLEMVRPRQQPCRRASGCGCRAGRSGTTGSSRPPRISTRWESTAQ
ncbi:MAG: hypothetical protein M5T61_12525 [Acidimicrobiia bacterium]|nr:hypothetical protein [Acidimicrobiia bacterium]